MTMEPVRYRDSTCDSRWREPRYGEVKDSLFTHLLMGCVSVAGMLALVSAGC
jgi:hypothetical protein